MPRILASGRTSSSTRVRVQNFPASLSFNGTTSNVILTQNVGLPIFSQSGYSISVWFNNRAITSPGSTTTIYSEANTGSNNQLFQLGVNGNKLFITIRNNANVAQVNVVVGTTIVVKNSWNHVCWVDNNGTATLYINGVADATNYNYTPATPYTLNTSAIGEVDRGTPTGFFRGSIGSTQLFNTALSAAQVLQVMQGSLKGNIGSYSLAEGAGTTAYDTSGNGNNGTITAGTYTADVPSKQRKLVGDNLVYNGDFEFAPPINVATTITANWIDGTTGGSATNSLFGWATAGLIGTASVLFDNSTSNSGNYSLKVSTLAIGSTSQAFLSNSTTVVPPSPPGILALPNTSYTVTFRMKTTANSGSATTGAQMIVSERSGSFVQSQTTSSPGITTTTGWTQYSLSFTTASNTRYITLKLSVTGNDGTATLIMDAFFDDIVLVPTVNVTRGLAT